MDVEDQRWFTRFFLRRTFLDAQRSREDGNGSGGGGRSEGTSGVGTSGVGSGGHWRAFVALDHGGTLFRTTERTTPTEYAIGRAKGGPYDQVERR